jgi:DNA-binding MarR family transcriptional regulator
VTPVEHSHRAFGAGRLLSAVERVVSEQMRSALEPYGLDLEEWRVLELLSDGEGHTMAETADFAVLPPPSLTKVVNRLVSNNLVHRRTGTVDRRQVLIRHTTRGLQKFDEVAGAIHLLERALFGSGSDRELLENVLGAIESNASSEAVSADH